MTATQAIGKTLLILAITCHGVAIAGAQTPPTKPAAGKGETYVSPVSANIPDAADKPAALVNGEMISMADVKAVLESRPYPNTLKAEDIKGYRKATVDMLVDDVLVRQFLAKYAPAVAPTDMTKEIDTLQAHLKKEGKTLGEFLKESGQSMDQLQKVVRARLQWQGYLQARLKEEDARKYYEANKPFFDKVQVRASHILIKVPAGATAEQKKTLQGRAEAIRQEIAGGKLTFEAAVKQYSECPSKDKGGDIGLFTYKFVVVEPIAQTAFRMKIGEISGVLATEYGYHVLKVTDRTQPKEQSTYESLREAVREVWAMDVELSQQIIAHQRKNSKIEVFLQ
jgi:parvulin-like peptidyl-prolyl isomerase